jgi:PAS domain S-box-containing protein
MSEPDLDPATGDRESFSSLFDLLAIGAYRSAPDGRMLRANSALVRLNGFDSEAQMMAEASAIGDSWYVETGRRAKFREALVRDGVVRAFVSEIWRNQRQERIWVSENAHAVRDAQGQLLYYEGTIEEVTEQVQAALQRSEAQFRLILEQLPCVVYHTHISPTGERRFTYISEGVERLAGVPREAIMNDPMFMLRRLHPEDAPHVLAAIDQAIQRNTSLTDEFRVVHDDGRVQWLYMAVNGLPAPDGGIIRIGVILDIQQRKAAEAALRDADQRWKLALEATGDGVWDWDLVTGREVFSPQFRAMYGFDESIPTTAIDFDRLAHPDDVAQMNRDREAHLSGAAPAYVNEHRILCRDGQWKWVLIRGLVISRDANGRPLRMIGTHTDITERKRAAEMQRERERAEADSRAKSDFLSRVSHELRTPLNAVLGFAQLMSLDTQTAPRHMAWVQQILASGEHLLGLVEDVLDLASAQTGQLSVSLQPVDVVPMIEQVWTMVASATRSGREQPVVAWMNHAAANGPVRVQADPKRLRQVLANLLSNARKYNHDGGQVSVQLASEGERVRLDVTDTGSGLSEAQLARLFSPFDRLGAEQSLIEGRGLGLALTRQLVVAMGGDIAAVSAVGQGSTFSVWLPAAQ